MPAGFPAPPPQTPQEELEGNGSSPFPEFPPGPPPIPQSWLERVTQVERLVQVGTQDAGDQGPHLGL